MLDINAFLYLCNIELCVGKDQLYLEKASCQQTLTTIPCICYSESDAQTRGVSAASARLALVVKGISLPSSKLTLIDHKCKSTRTRNTEKENKAKKIRRCFGGTGTKANNCLRMLKSEGVVGCLGHCHTYT